MFIFERETETEYEWKRGRERERETQNLKQAPVSELSVLWGLNPRTMTQTPGQSWMLNQLSHQGTPGTQFFQDKIPVFLSPI